MKTQPYDTECRKIKDILLRQKDSERVAVTYGERSLTYKEISDEAYLHSANILSIKANRNVGLYFGNSADYVVGYFSVCFSDKVIIPLEPSLKADELESIIKYCEISLIVTGEEGVNALTSLLSDINFKIDIYGIDSKEKVSVGTGKYLEQGNDDEEDVAIMLHTSGTTSDPKRVMLTNANIVSNVKANVEAMGIGRDDVSMIVLPIYFSYCNTSQFLSHFYVGAQIVIFESSFEPRKVLSKIEKQECTNVSFVPSMLTLILKSCKRSRYNLEKLRFISSGGGKTPPELIPQVVDFFGEIRFVQTYGLTEAGPRVSTLMGEDAIEKLGSVGLPLPGVSIEIRDESDRTLAPGEVGEIVVKSPGVMPGYYKKEDITSLTIVNGWLHTGDLGMKDKDGYLFIIGRKKNVIISGGLNIYPEEIEETLVSHDDIIEAMAYPEADDFMGEVPIVKVVKKTNTEINETDILEYLKTRLSAYKLPSRVEFCDSIAKTYSGKIIRNKREGRK